MDSWKMDPAIPKAFGIVPDGGVVPLNGGHINDTFLARQGKNGYVLQRINRYVFPSPEQVMENLVGITEFLQNKLRLQGGDPDRETLTVYKTLEGKNLYTDAQGEAWRCTRFISGASSRETPGDPVLLQEAGQAFGRFQSMLSDYPADSLHQIIPDFHNTPVRMAQLRQAMDQNAAGRRREVGRELEFALSREKDCGFLMEYLRCGKLPLRVTHNDTKMSNVLFDDATGKAVCVIDLDTVMPGLSAFDFGDSIRAGASTASEDEQDLSQVRLDLSLFAAYARGFLSQAGEALTPLEISTLPMGALWITFETGIRFLADYLNGDVYFHTAYPTHNLDRARNQFKLVEEMEEKREEMECLILETAE